MKTARLVRIPLLAGILVVCRTDRRSAEAADLLVRAGFRDIEVLEGGMEQWNLLGLPANRKSTAGPCISR